MCVNERKTGGNVNMQEEKTVRGDEFEYLRSSIKVLESVQER